MAEFKLGQTVETTDGRKGVIRYIGDIPVAAGQFIGLELPDAGGKNDGSIRGERFFDCAPAHGLFTRPAGILRIISQPAPPKSVAQKPAAPKPAAASKLSAGGSRPSLRPGSIGGAPKASSRPSTTASRLSIVPASQQAASKPLPRKPSVSASSTSTTSKPLARPPPQTAPRPAPSSSSTFTASKPIKDSPVKSGSNDDLQTKIRHLEKQLAEYKEQLKELDTIKADKLRFEGIIQKLQSKYQTLHQEVAELKSKNKALDADNERMSRNEQENESVLELAAIDKEMAEERTEQAMAEIELLRQRLAEKELELEIAQSEAEMLTEDMSDEDKRAAGYYHIQNENDRLKQALLRLKDISEDIETELKACKRDLEVESAQNEELRNEVTSLRAEKDELLAAVDDLRQQIDAGNALEDMVVELSEQCEQLKDQIAEKDMIIKDLENIKELNDELEVHHIEQANDLRSELEAKDVELAEKTAEATQQRAVVVDQEMLINKFRDLALDLQSKANDAESLKLMSEEQAKDVTGRFNEAMELNRRLHSVNITSTARTITSELQKLQADEAQEELEIVKHYLPDSSEIYKNDPLRAYFRAKRVAFKANLSSSLLSTLNAKTNTGEDGEYFILELLRQDCILQLRNLGIKSEQFWSAMSTTSVERFTSFSPAHEELSPVEGTVERCLDALKKDELSYTEVSDALRRSNQIFNSVAQDFKDTLDARDEEQFIFRVSSMKAHLEAIKAALVTMRSSVQEIGVVDGDWNRISTFLIKQLSSPIDESNDSLVAATKLLKTLRALKADSLYPYLPAGIQEVIEHEESVRNIATHMHTLALEFTKYMLAYHGETTEIPAMEVSNHFDSLQEVHFPGSELMSLEFVAIKLNSWNEFASVLMNNVEIEHDAAPWVLKARELENAKNLSAEAEKKLQTLTAEHHTTVLQIRERDEIIDTKELEIEHLRAKHREAAGKAETITRLQSELQEAQKDRERYRQDITKQQTELERLKERGPASEQSEAVDMRSKSPELPQPPNILPVPQSDTAKTFVTFIQALQNENHWLRRRESREMFGHNLKEMFSRMQEYHAAQAKKEKRRQQKHADEMLALSLSLERFSISDLSVDSPAKIDQDTLMFSSPPDAQSTPPYIGLPKRSKRRNRSPIRLAPLKVPLSWTPEADTPASHYSNLEDLSFIDLSPVAEEFSAEMEESLEGLSALGEITMNSIMERATVHT